MGRPQRCLECSRAAEAAYVNRATTVGDEGWPRNKEVLRERD